MNPPRLMPSLAEVVWLRLHREKVSPEHTYKLDHRERKIKRAQSKKEKTGGAK